MATYKVLQDIEAEDKLVGPLSLRQFIYAVIAAVCLYICFLGIARNTAFLVGIFLPVALICGFFAFPWKGEQPTEIWALARLRFMIKPRVRIWNQSGVKEIVTVTAPKILDQDKPHSDNLSQNEVRSRLKALADTIDSRGWATRNVNYRYYTNAPQTSDRLVNASDLQPGSVPLDAFLPSNDMLDDNGTVAQTIDSMLQQSQAAQRQQAMQQAQYGAVIQQPAAQPIARPQQYITPAPPPAPIQPPVQTPAPVATANLYANPVASAPVASAASFVPTPQWPVPATPAPSPIQTTQLLQSTPYAANATAEPPLAAAGPQLLPELPAPIATPEPLPVVNAPQWFTPTSAPASSIAVAPSVAQTPAAVTSAPTLDSEKPKTGFVNDDAMTRPVNPAILKLANNNDLNVATLARQADREVRHATSDSEVEVTLH